MTRTVFVGFLHDAGDLFLRRHLSKARHHLRQLSTADLAVSVSVEYVERLSKLLKNNQQSINLFI